MEHLRGLVGRESTVSATRMPVWIDHSTAERIVTGLQVFFLAVAVDDGSTMIASGMEHVLVWIRAIGCMAVQAGTVEFAVLDEHGLLEIGKVALKESHVTVYLVAGRDAAIGDAPFTEWLLTDVDGKVTITCPAAVFLSADTDSQSSALILFQELVPVIYVEIGV